MPISDTAPSSPAVTCLSCRSALFAPQRLPAPSRAQDWPSRPLTMVVPFAAGGPMDSLARILQPTLGETLGQPIIIENVPGGGGMTGSMRVSQAAADSHLFVLASIGTHAISYSMHAKPMYHPANDFQPVAFIADAPLMLMTKKDLPPNNLKEFMAYTKANHDKMMFSLRRHRHLVACQLRDAEPAHRRQRHPRALPRRRAGVPGRDRRPHRLHLQLRFHRRAGGEGRTGQGAGDARRQRTSALPDLPTADEQGLKNFDVSAWNAILLPKSATPAMVAKMNAAVSKALDNPAMRGRLDALGLIPATPERRSADYLRGYINAEIGKWAGPVKAAGVSNE